MKPDWKDAPEWANWLAQDCDGEWLWYSNKPTLSDGFWDRLLGQSMQRERAGYSSYTYGYEDSLEQRPSSDVGVKQNEQYYSQGGLQEDGSVIGSERSRKFIHKRTGNHYYVVSSSHKMKIAGVWCDAVLYRNAEGETFSRTRDDFYGNFVDAKSKVVERNAPECDVETDMARRILENPVMHHALKSMVREAVFNALEDAFHDRN